MPLPLVVALSLMAMARAQYQVVSPYAAEGYITLRGSGTNETANGLAKASCVFQAVQDGAGKPVQIEYRVVSASQASTDFLTTPSSTQVVDFGVTGGPIPSARWTSGITQVPFSYQTVSVFFNLPGILSLNLTACILSRILRADITSWSVNDITVINPTATFDDPTNGKWAITSANIFLEGSESVRAPSTQALYAYLIAGTATCTGFVWTASTVPLVATYLTAAEIWASITKTPYSGGVLMSYAGKAVGLSEASIKTNFATTEYVSSKNFDSTTTRTAVETALGTSFTTNIASTVSTAFLASTKAYPIIVANYIFYYTSQAASGDKGPALRALVQFLLSSNGQAFLTANNQLGFSSGSTGALTTYTTAANGTNLVLQTNYVEYVIDTNTSTIGASSVNSLSTARTSATTILLNNLQNQINALQATVDQTAPKILRGSGASAVTLVVRRNMDALMAHATTPVWMSYRGTGSGFGRNEIYGSTTSPNASCTPPVAPASARGCPTSNSVVDFGCSDTPFAKAHHTAMDQAGYKLLQIPMHLAPIAFFANIPVASLPSQKLRLSACTLVSIFQGSITKWNDPLIQADNPGVNVSSLNNTIIPGYRKTSISSTGSASGSGTNEVWSAWMIDASILAGCQGTSAWTLTIPTSASPTRPAPSQTLPQVSSTGTILASGTFSTIAVGVSNSDGMTALVKDTPWSIGYMDAGNGQSFGLMEIAIQNKDGTWLTTSSGSGWPTASVSDSAAQLIQSSAWPSSPTGDWSGVTLINQAGNLTWPITSAPFMFVRADSTARGASGQILLSLIRYMISDDAQKLLPSFGFAPLPSVILTYINTKIIPLLSINNQYPAWTIEPAVGSALIGAGDNIFSLAKDTYIRPSVTQLVASSAASQLAAATAARAASSTPPAGTSLSGIDLSSLAGVSQLQSTQNNQNSQIQILQNVAIAALAFALAALALAIFAVIRLFVVTTTGSGNGGLSGVMPGSMNTGSVKGAGSFGHDSHGMH